MARLGGRLLLGLNLLVANAAAVVVVIARVRPEAFAAEPPAESRLPLALDSAGAHAAIATAVTLLLLNGLWLLRRKPLPPPLQHVTSETPSGPVRIAREALEAGLRAAGEGLPEITRLRVAVDTSHPRRIGVHGQFQCAEGVSNLVASQRLRTALQERFHAIVQLPEGARVDFELEFLGFAGKLSKRAAEAPAPGPEPQPFTGPQYPIEDDDGPGGRG